MTRISNKIPLNKLEVTAVGGLDVWHLKYSEDLKHLPELEDHRDDYFILVIVIKGSGVIRCDMETLFIRPKSILLVRPYQVHSGTMINKDAEAYFIRVAPFLMPEFCRTVFESMPVPSQYLKVPPAEMSGIVKTSDLLLRSFTGTNHYKSLITNNLLNALMIHAASLFFESTKRNKHPENQSQLITQKFRQLVSDHSFLHSPSFFSKKLNITTSHLNDCVKSITGVSVTCYLQDAMLLEAKRNLYYTNDDVKAIAFRLGFEDHSYFSRLFKKLTKETPLSFRTKFRE